jgi:two-component system, LytTR family, response regulator
MIRTIIIDDEPGLREMNRVLLEQNFNNIEIVATCGSVEDGTHLIKSLQPQLVLLDIQLSDGTAFQLLQNVKEVKFSIIFITAHNEFALKAFKFSAIDYILKPVNEHEFCAAIDRALSTINHSKIGQQVDTFFEYYERKNQNRKIVLKTAESINIIEISDIGYCKSDNSYTTFYLRNKEKILVSKGMKEYEELLTDYGFFRPHHSFLVNLQYVSRMDKSDGGFLILKDHTEIPVSTRRKAKLIQVLESI